ncbi:hypothetical protein [Microbacterium sp. 18062]|uniref:hypothetical protein n=1 Tax=Microbacterium sp. 18062 TaxID=2681410 RepID=UPI00135B1946|nr:hypothetical protein [Microbacterium sp. 18062]
MSIAPGRTALAGMCLDVGEGGIARLEIELPAASGATVLSPDDLGAVTVSEAAAAQDPVGTIVSGTVTSTFAMPQEYIGVTVLARDAAGTIIDAGWSFADVLPSGGSAPFESRFYEPLPADTVFEAYPTL